MIDRRAFLRGKLQPQDAIPRPPWAVAENDFVITCTRCDACIDTCPERILARGDGGFPQLDFKLGGCTFCGDCVAVCEPAALMKNDQARPIPFVAKVTDACVSAKGVTCRSCGDECEARAIRFQLQLGGRADVILDQESCTGCGACLRICPVQALQIEPISRPEEAA